MELCTAQHLSLDATVVAVQSQVSADLNDETVILELNSGVYYGLNSTGSFIWTRLQQPISVRALCNALFDTYDVDPEQSVRSVMELLRELLAHHLIEVRDGSSP